MCFYSFAEGGDRGQLEKKGTTQIKEGEKKEKKERKVRRYIRPTIYYNVFTTSKREIKSEILKDYKFTQSNTGFYFPIYTTSWYRADGVTLTNVHFLGAGNLLFAKPHFSGLETQHQLYKFSMGLRMIYNTGIKNIWFFHVGPYLSQDNYTISSPKARLASVFLLNRTVSRKFSYRLGILRTFIFGHRINLPIIGFRFGPLDGTYVSFQLPKRVALYFPIGQKFTGGIYIKPFGGLYTFSNKNTRFDDRDTILVFRRYEILNGLILNYRYNRNFSFYLSGGVTHDRYLAFAEVNTSDGIFNTFFRKEIDKALFLNIGLAIRMGKAVKVYNDINMYDVFDLNNLFDPGDVNDGPMNDEIPQIPKNKDIRNIQYLDVRDLMSEFDLY
ncbi:hypothetical protein JYT51_00160 [Candidatus Amoebophilus asiaticus]|nr:hypothetical protein [Candidatus Amoebophilus asiaticus]